MNKNLKTLLCNSILISLFLISNNLKSKDNESITQLLKNNKIEYVMFSFSDLLGNLKEVTMPVDKTKDAFESGITFDGSSVAGYSSITQSDLILKPDVNTFRICPWTKDKYKTAWIICDIYKDSNNPFEISPRYILRKISKYAANVNYKFNVGPEIEFFINEKNSQQYFDPAQTEKEINFKLKILETLTSLNVPVEKVHHEVASGQYEVSIKYGDALDIADQIIISKYAIKLVANNFGYEVTFMPKPYNNQNGSGMHIHYSLFNIKNDGHNKNAFSDLEDKSNVPVLSAIAKQFLAGNLNYISDISSLFNSTTNSFKRLVPGYEAPIYIGWGYINRSTLIRMPKLTNNSSSSVRLELRCPDALCNPYLAFSGLLYSGLKGINQKLNLVEPIDSNLYRLTTEEKVKLNIKALPESLTQAIDNLEKSEFAKELLGIDAHKAFIKIKRKECRLFNTYVTSWERKYYA